MVFEKELPAHITVPAGLDPKVVNEIFQAGVAAQKDSILSKTPYHAGVSNDQVEFCGGCDYRLYHEEIKESLAARDAEVAKLERAVVKHKANYEAANNESCEILKSEEKFRIKVTELVDALEAISKNIHPTNAWARIIANNILDKFKGGGE